MRAAHFRNDTPSYDFGERSGQRGLWLRVGQSGPGENDLLSCDRLIYASL